MFHALKTSAAQAVMQRLVLLANHVLASETAATDRLRIHAGRHIRLELKGWPALLPTLPPLSFDVTPAGLLEWRDDIEVAPLPDLQIAIDATNPALAFFQGLTGTKPKPAIDITGDAQLASDVNWLIENLRWDVEDDLARIVGQAPARQIARVGQAVASAFREVAGRIGGLAARAGGSASGPG
jgi:ubiquinone biosynthesis protein UbiJ